MSYLGGKFASLLATAVTTYATVPIALVVMAPASIFLFRKCQGSGPLHVLLSIQPVPLHVVSGCTGATLASHEALNPFNDLEPTYNV